MKTRLTKSDLVRIEVKLTPEMAAAIDEVRGDVERNEWIRETAIRAALAKALGKAAASIPRVGRGRPAPTKD